MKRTYSHHFVLSLTLALMMLLMWSRAGHSSPVASKELEARALFLKGVEATEANNWQSALKFFLRSRAIIDRPNTTFNIGRVLLELNRRAEAQQAFEHYLETADPARDEALCSEAEAHLRRIKEDSKSEVVSPAKPSRSPPGAEAEGERSPSSISAGANDPGDPPLPVQTEALPLEKPALDLSEAPPPESASQGAFWSSPVVWIVGAAVIVGSGVALGFLLGGGEEAPYSGNTGVVLRGLGP